MLCRSWNKPWVEETLIRLIQNIFDVQAVQTDRLPVDVQHLISEQVAHFHTRNVCQGDNVE